MGNVLRHRGPDGEGYVLFQGERFFRLANAVHERLPDGHLTEVALGHRRLSIVDLSPAGAQPMADAAMRYWLTYNGELYNYLELRAELEALGFGFHTRTDTEVILRGYEAWGEDCLSRFNGMFAFVLYDRVARTVFGARDRFGVKPLYYWRSPSGEVAFASEIKAFTVLPGWSARMNGQAAYEFLNWGITDHNEATLFEGVLHVPPGHSVKIAIDRVHEALQPRRWYQIPAAGITTSTRDVISAWRETFIDAVAKRLRADVPVGTALSGGLDSSSIVCAVHEALGHRAGQGNQNAFSARSRDRSFDEGHFISTVVHQTGVELHEVWPEPDVLFACLDDMTWHLDEPFASTSVFAEWCVFRKVAETPVKVTLDGHGADEVLAGYRTFAAPLLASLIRQGEWISALKESRALIANGHRPAVLAAQLLDCLAPSQMRYKLRSVTGQPTPYPKNLHLTRFHARPSDPFEAEHQSTLTSLSISQLTSTSLPMQLRWTDRNSMAHSVESRAPFLDYRLVEQSLGLPDELKLSGGTSKLILRKALARLLPNEIACRRDKMGFVTAEELWVRRDRPEAFRTALAKAAKSAGDLFSQAALDEAEAVIAGRRSYDRRLWRMISFGFWLERFNVAHP